MLVVPSGAGFDNANDRRSLCSEVRIGIGESQRLHSAIYFSGRVEFKNRRFVGLIPKSCNPNAFVSRRAPRAPVVPQTQREFFVGN